MTTMKVPSKLLLGVLLVLGLSGCGLRAWIDVDIEEDSSGTVTVQFQSDRELREGLAAFSPDTDVTAQLSEGLAENGWDIAEAPTDGEWEGVVATTSFDDFGELSGLLDQAVQGGGSSVQVVETANVYRLEAELGPPAGDDNQQELLSQAADVVDLDGRLTVRFPGQVTETNGEIGSDGSTVVWSYDEETIVGLEIVAEAQKPAGLWPWAIGAIVVVAIGGAVIAVVLMRSRRVEVG